MTAGAVHPVDVFFVALGEEEIESETDIQVAVESSAVGFKDRIPAEGWLSCRSGRAYEFRTLTGERVFV